MKQVSLHGDAQRHQEDAPELGRGRGRLVDDQDDLRLAQLGFRPFVLHKQTNEHEQDVFHLFVHLFKFTNN